MPPIEIGPLRPVGAVPSRNGQEAAPLRASAAKAAPGSPARAPSTAMEAGDALDPGRAPVDSDRVAEIRNAVEQGRYPVIPARIADAMIAAGILLRTR
ncbi:flagellar biosynthesis anti-sigma factor FlgM [Novosphingobium sp. ZN18A2]|uniref:flagellar biosynthesis anti-sigma factor FlgM n=1 Tax=Novosphingobium sp. ZN18A2 TaxID=3079861 RepID=UPI0030CF7CAD